MSWLVLLLLFLIHAPLLPYLVFLLLVSAAALLPRRKRDLAANPTSRFLFVIPAHDEEPVVSKVVESCLAVDYPRSQFDVLVIADNCTDGTAFLARTAGARVVERFDEAKKSKGHAIQYLIGTLEQSGELDRTRRAGDRRRRHDRRRKPAGGVRSRLAIRSRLDSGLLHGWQPR